MRLAAFNTIIFPCHFFRCFRFQQIDSEILVRIFSMENGKRKRERERWNEIRWEGKLTKANRLEQWTKWTEKIASTIFNGYQRVLYPKSHSQQQRTAAGKPGIISALSARTALWITQLQIQECLMAKTNNKTRPVAALKQCIMSCSRFRKPVPNSSSKGEHLMNASVKIVLKVQLQSTTLYAYKSVNQTHTNTSVRALDELFKFCASAGVPGQNSKNLSSSSVFFFKSSYAKNSFICRTGRNLSLLRVLSSVSKCQKVCVRNSHVQMLW